MQGSCSRSSIQEEEHALEQLEEELNNVKQSINTLHANLDERDQRKVNIINEMRHLEEKINESANPMVRSLVYLIKLSKALEKQEFDFQSHCKAKQSELQAEVVQLQEKISNATENRILLNSLDDSMHNALEKLNSAKMELAGKLRANLLLKHQHDSVPSQMELIQYERCFSELYIHIQEKLRKTRTCYGTYNALLEMKELMLKEMTLLNSISSQFQDAFSTSAGRMKLVDSMEGIVRGTKQKLEKANVALQAEQKVCDALKEKYAASIAEQRHSSSLLKAFKDECAKNERLRNLTSVRG